MIHAKTRGKGSAVPERERRAMRSLLALGYSAREIGLLFKRHRTLVQLIVGRGWEAREAKRGQPRPHQYNARWYYKEARNLYQRHHGVTLHTAQHIHHVNHDYTDNRIENLIVLSASEHARHHHPRNPIPRWMRTERKQYQRSYMKQIRTIPKKCQVCSADFLTTKYSRGLVCSPACLARYIWRLRRAKMQAE